MANQSSYRSHRPMPYSGRSGSGRSMYDMNRNQSARSVHDSNRNRSVSDCPCEEIRTLPADNTREQMRDNNCNDRSDRSVTCVATANFPVGMTYVPMQMWGPLYDHPKALCQGTLFPELDKPFMGGRAAR